MKLENTLDKRINDRIGIQKECILVNGFGLVEAETIDISKNGIGLKSSNTMPFKIGSELTVSIPGMGNYLAKAKLLWTKKDSNNMTRLGLKFIVA